MTESKSIAIINGMPDDANEPLDNFLEQCTQSSSQLVNSKPTPIPYLLDSLPLIIRGNYHLLTGPVGNMKSMLSLYLAGELSKKEKVLFVDKENGLLMIEARARALRIPETENLYYWCERPGMSKEETPPDFKTGFKLYERIVREWKSPVLIFDTLNRFCPGADENSVKDMTFVTDCLMKLRNLGATVIALHQVGKPSIEKGYQNYRGSSEIAGGMDIGLTIKNFTQATENSASFTIHQFKTRWLPHPPIQVVFEFGIFNFLPEFMNPERFFSLRKAVTEYLSKNPEVRGEEIKQAMSSKSYGGHPVKATSWMLANCWKNYWIRLDGPMNSFVYKNLPIAKK